jgi:hypothetical protein
MADPAWNAKLWNGSTGVAGMELERHKQLIKLAWDEFHKWQKEWLKTCYWPQLWGRDQALMWVLIRRDYFPDASVSAFESYWKPWY